MGLFIFLIVVVVVVALVAWRRSQSNGAPGDQDRRLAEAQIAQRDAMFSFDPQGPEKTATVARQALAQGRPEEGFTRSVKAIDQLHDLYGFDGFAHRQASPRDAVLIDTLRDCLQGLRRADPNADVRAGVREATHRLRSISTTIEEARSDASLYRRGLDDLARLASDVNVDDIFWH